MEAEIEPARGNRWVLAGALALIVVGVIAVLGWSDGDAPLNQARVAETTSTTLPTEVLGVVVDNTTTTSTAAPAATTTTTTVAVAKPTTTVKERTGRINGYSYPSQPNDETTVSVSKDGQVVASVKTDDNGWFEFLNLPAGTYDLARTSRTTDCPATTTTSPDGPNCTTASSTGTGPEVTLSPGGEVRADVF